MHKIKTKYLKLDNAELCIRINRNKNMMATAFRMSNINIIVMIIKRKYIGVGIHVLTVVGQKITFLVLHVK